jgi:hypothetical protein
VAVTFIIASAARPGSGLRSSTTTSVNPLLSRSLTMVILPHHATYIYTRVLRCHVRSAIQWRAMRGHACVIHSSSIIHSRARRYCMDGHHHICRHRYPSFFHDHGREPAAALPVLLLLLSSWFNNGQHVTLRFGFPRSLFQCEDMPACVVNSSSIHSLSRTHGYLFFHDHVRSPAGHHGSTKVIQHATLRFACAATYVRSLFQ